METIRSELDKIKDTRGDKENNYMSGGYDEYL